MQNMNYTQFTAPQGVDTKNKITRTEVERYCSENHKKLNAESIGLLVNTEQELTREWFIDNIGKDYYAIRRELIPEHFLTENLTLNSFLNELTIMFPINYTLLRSLLKDVNIDTIRYTAAITIANLLNADLSLIQSSQIAINEYWYNKKYNISQKEDIIYDTFYEAMIEFNKEFINIL